MKAVLTSLEDRSGRRKSAVGAGHPRTAAASARPLLEIRDLHIRFRERGGCADVVKGLSCRLSAGQSLGIVGESGSGKSVSCRAVMGLLPRTAEVSGSIKFDGKELLGLAENEIRRYRGAEIALVFQDASQSLNPTIRVGMQIGEAVRRHTTLDRTGTQSRVLELLRALKVHAPEEVALAYPHELSGGMRQRVMIASALAGNPRLLIADEPTSALDLVTQAELLDLLKSLQSRLHMAVLLITHDLLLAADFADDLLVMRRGSAVEYAPADRLLDHPRTDYAKALINAIPRFSLQQNGYEPMPAAVSSRDVSEPCAVGVASRNAGSLSLVVGAAESVETPR